MKFKVMMKCPDAFDDAVNEYIEDFKAAHDDYDEENLDELEFQMRSKATLMKEKYFTWGEYLTVEVDAFEGTCEVVSNE